MAPRVGFEPTASRLTADCSTTELPRTTRIPPAPPGHAADACWRRGPDSNRCRRICSPQDNHSPTAPCNATVSACRAWSQCSRTLPPPGVTAVGGPHARRTGPRVDGTPVPTCAAHAAGRTAATASRSLSSASARTGLPARRYRMRYRRGFPRFGGGGHSAGVRRRSWRPVPCRAPCPDRLWPRAASRTEMPVRGSGHPPS